MSWHPPIPSEAVYRDEVATLGAGIRLLWYLYNGVQRDGTVLFSVIKASSALNVPYETARTWWQLLRPLGIVTVEEDRGKKGYLLRFDDDWLDWHVLAANYTRPASTGGERAIQPVEHAERAVNGFSTAGERATQPVEDPAYKVLHVDQESSPSQPPRASRTPDRAMVMMMADKGIKSAKALNEIAAMGLDYATVEQSIDNLLADKTTIGAIVELLKTAPPETGRPYPRARAPASRVTIDLPTPPERPVKSVLSASERRQLLEQHRNGSS